MAVLQGITIKLQERALDVVKAYSMVSKVITNLERLRQDPTVFAQWFEQVESVAKKIGVVSIDVPILTGRQAHRVNQPDDKTCNGIL